MLTEMFIYCNSLQSNTILLFIKHLLKHGDFLNKPLLDNELLNVYTPKWHHISGLHYLEGEINGKRRSVTRAISPYINTAMKVHWNAIWLTCKYNIILYSNVSTILI